MSTATYPDKEQVIEQARERWKDILTALGVDAAHLTGKGVPCPMCAGHDRFTFTDRSQKGDYICRGCGAGDGFDLLEKFRGWKFPVALREVAQVVGTLPAETPKPRRQEKRDPLPLLKRIAREAKKLTGSDPASAYLKARGLSVIPDVLRWHPALAYYEDGKRVGTYPAMLSLVVDADGNPLTYQRTYLLDGKKAPVGSPRKLVSGLDEKSGYAVRLFPQAEHLGVAEGVETALAAHELTGLPVWSVVDANGITKFEPPPGVRAVTIFADHDSNFAGQAAAYTLAHRLAEKLEIEVQYPPKVGTDFLDALAEIRRAAA